MMLQCNEAGKYYQLSLLTLSSNVFYYVSGVIFFVQETKKKKVRRGITRWSVFLNNSENSILLKINICLKSKEIKDLNSMIIISDNNH